MSFASLDLGCRLALAVVLGTAFAGKLRGPRPFHALVSTMTELGMPAMFAIRPVAALVLALELAATVLVITVPLVGYPIAAALLLAFTAVVINALRRDEPVACRCFGASTAPIGPAHVVRNLLLLAVAGSGAALYASGSTGELGLVLVLGVTGVLVGSLVTRWDDLIFLLGSRPRTP